MTLPAVTLAEMLELDLPDFDLEPRYNAAPSQRMPVIADDRPYAMQLMKWGLIPSWAKDPAIGHKLINARAETITEKPAFRHAFAHSRCLVLVDGFYEWQPTPLGKVPHHIRRKDKAVITLAGLWESWKDAEGREIRSFNIITVPPNALMESIHDRMPAIIEPQDRKKWLERKTTVAELHELLRPYAGDDLEAVEVGRGVNSPLHEGPSLLDPPPKGLF